MLWTTGRVKNRTTFNERTERPREDGRARRRRRREYTPARAVKEAKKSRGPNPKNGKEADGTRGGGGIKTPVVEGGTKEGREGKKLAWQ